MRGGIVLLLLVSLFVVAALVVAVVDSGTLPLSATARSAFLASLAAGAAALAVVLGRRMPAPASWPNSARIC
jgi:hypothetical protein